MFLNRDVNRRKFDIFCGAGEDKENIAYMVKKVREYRGSIVDGLMIEEDLFRAKYPYKESKVVEAIIDKASENEEDYAQLVYNLYCKEVLTVDQRMILNTRGEDVSYEDSIANLKEQVDQRFRFKALANTIADMDECSNIGTFSGLMTFVAEKNENQIGDVINYLSGKGLLTCRQAEKMVALKKQKDSSARSVFTEVQKLVSKNLIDMYRKSDSVTTTNNIFIKKLGEDFDRSAWDAYGAYMTYPNNGRSVIELAEIFVKKGKMSENLIPYIEEQENDKDRLLVLDICHNTTLKKREDALLGEAYIFMSLSERYDELRRMALDVHPRSWERMTSGAKGQMAEDILGKPCGAGLEEEINRRFVAEQLEFSKEEPMNFPQLSL